MSIYINDLYINTFMKWFRDTKQLKQQVEHTFDSAEIFNNRYMAPKPTKEAMM